MQTYEVCYGFLNKMNDDKSMWWYQKEGSMGEMIRKVVGCYSNELIFTIIELNESRATIYLPAADVNGDGEFRRIYKYG